MSLNLPNSFLADLPPEAVLTPAMIHDACDALKRNREQWLAPRSTESLIRLLAEVGRNWLQPDYPFRCLVLEHGPAATKFSVATLANGLDAFFRQLTRENLQALIVQDLGDIQRLDELTNTIAEKPAGRAALVRGPELLAHVAAGTIPVAVFSSIILGLLLRAAQFAKCARGTSLLPRLFAHSLADADPKLARCLELAEWRGGDAALEEALFAEADVVTATGRDETLADLHRRLPPRVRFVGYGHRVSFGYVAADALSGPRTAQRVAAQAAADVVAWNQLGCLSPHVIYAQHGGSVSPESFAELLAAELEQREAAEPRGELAIETAAAITSRRGFYEVRATAHTEIRLWSSRQSTAWTVVFDANSLFQLSCLHRFIYVKAVGDLAEALQGADAIRPNVSTVGLAATEAKAHQLALELARWGVPRVCPLGRMQQPPLTWRHDGRPALGDLVVWTDWEME